MIFYQTQIIRPSVLYAYRYSNSNKFYKNKELPAYFDINVSLLSNIQKRKSFQEVFTLHKLMRSYYTPKHIAKSLRVLTQIIDKEQVQSGRVQKIKIFIIKSHQQEWIAFLSHIWQIKDSIVAAEDKLDFLHFIYKTAQHRILLTILKPSYGIQLCIFRRSLILSIMNPNSIQQFSIQQLAVIFYYFRVINESKAEIIAVMQQIKKQLAQNKKCHTLHLILISKTLRDIQRTQNDFLDKSVVESLKKDLAGNLASQIPQILEYIDITALIQIYNVVSSYHPELTEAMIKRAELLLPELREKTFNYTFINQELPLFLKDLQARSGENCISEELLKVLNELMTSKPWSKSSPEWLSKKSPLMTSKPRPKSSPKWLSKKSPLMTSKPRPKSSPKWLSKKSPLMTSKPRPKSSPEWLSKKSPLMTSKPRPKSSPKWLSKKSPLEQIN